MAPEHDLDLNLSGPQLAVCPSFPALRRRLLCLPAKDRERVLRSMDLGLAEVVELEFWMIFQALEVLRGQDRLFELEVQLAEAEKETRSLPS